MTEPSITVWLDPGKVTGAATYDHRAGVFASIEIGNDLKQLGSWLELLAHINDGYNITDDDGDRFRIVLGWERYVITPGNTRHGIAYWSLEAIGVAHYLALKHDFTILKPQMSSVMTAVSDDQLKAAGWYRPGKGHANDAARHMMRYMMKSGTLPAELRDKIFTSSDEELVPCEYDDETF